MSWLLIFLFLTTTLAAPLSQTSLISLRTTQSQPSAGGNRVLYKEIILEEWSSSSILLQNWSLPCTLPDIGTETLTEGLLRSSYPLGDGVWFLCREVPVGSNLTYTPAPVLIMNLQEDGVLQQWASDTTSYPPGTSANLVYTWYDSTVGNQVFYTLGGFSPPSSTGQLRPAQPRIRMDSGPGTPPDLQGALANIATNVNPTGMSIMTDSLYIPALIPNGTSPAFFSVFLVMPENTLPTGTRSIVSYALNNIPLMLSVWTFPWVDTLWFTGFNRVPYLARTNFSISDPTQQTLVFPLPPSGNTGTLGGSSWRVSTARFEGEYFTTGDTLYLNNGTTIVKNNVLGLAQGLPYQPVLQAPPGWKYMDVHARAPNLPTPSATATATATVTSSSTATSSTTSSGSTSATPTATTSSTAKPSLTASSSTSASASASASSTASSSRYPHQSPDPNSPSPSASNGTLPVPAFAPTRSTPLTPGEVTGVSLGVVGAFGILGLLLLKYSPTVKNLYTRQFGSSWKGQPKGKTVRKPVSSDGMISISHNPNILVLQRLEQLRNLQKETSKKELETKSPSTIQQDKRKKQFTPVITVQA